MMRETQGCRDTIAYNIGEGQALCLPFTDVSLLPGGGAVIADVGSKNGTSIEVASDMVAEQVAVTNLVHVGVKVGEANREGNPAARSLYCSRRGLFGVIGDHGGEEMDRFVLLTYSQLAPWRWLVQPSDMVAAQLARAMAKAGQTIPEASTRLNGSLVQVMTGPLEAEQRLAWATYGAAALYHVGRHGVRRQDQYEVPGAHFATGCGRLARRPIGDRTTYAVYGRATIW